MKTKHLLALLLLALLPLPLTADIRLPAVIGDNMVLQQQTDVLLWGEASPRCNITLEPSWSQSVYTPRTDDDGNWKITLPTITAGGPYKIAITAGKDTKTLKNVLLGEVWLCGGQSNMDVSFRGLANQPVADAADEILDSAYPDLRLFRVKRDFSLQPRHDCRGSWTVSSPESAETFSAIGFLFGRMLHQREKVPVGMIVCAWGGSEVEAWMSRENLMRFAGVRFRESADLRTANVTPTALYNAMLLPISGYTIKGCIFYQGEANITDPAAYRTRFPAMVAEWRARWGEEFPFFYVQLAPYGYTNMGWSPDQTQAARFREVQQQCMSDIPRSGMVATTDIGAVHTIHPPDKKTVAKRLLYLAYARCYGYKGFECSGPVYKSMEIQGENIALSFDHAPYGVSSYGEPLAGFEIAGEDRIFHPAEAWLKGRSTVIVHSGEVKAPIAVRYCYKNYAYGNLYNNYGIVAPPFRTDDWNE